MHTYEIFEAAMIICFGISWPLSLIRSVKARSTKGKSFLFLCFIWFGYISGIVSKILAQNFNLAFYFYFPNLLMVSADICLFFRNRRIERSEKQDSMT